MDRPTAEVLSIRQVYKGRVFSVSADTVRLPGNYEVTFDVVRHLGSVVLLPVTDDGRVILVRQYRYVVDRWVWELPAGSLKPEEDLAAAAARECEEEIARVPQKVEKLMSAFPTPGYCDEEMNFFRVSNLCDPAPDSDVKPDEDELLEPQAFTIAELRDMIRRGEIVDLKTIAGVALLEWEKNGTKA